MLINVRFFAQLRELAGASGAQIAVAEEGAVDVAALIRSIGDSHGDELLSALRAENIRVAVNQELVQGEIALSDGDEVAFLPPVTGG